jgi:hypothetical protein
LGNLTVLPTIHKLYECAKSKAHSKKDARQKKEAKRFICSVGFRGGDGFRETAKEQIRNGRLRQTELQPRFRYRWQPGHQYVLRPA